MEVFSRNYYVCVDVILDNDCLQQRQSFDLVHVFFFTLIEIVLDCAPFLTILLFARDVLLLCEGARRDRAACSDPSTRKRRFRW